MAESPALPRRAFLKGAAIGAGATVASAAHGYAKVEGKPMACMMQAAVGLQHGAMSIYNTWAGPIPRPRWPTCRPPRPIRAPPTSRSCRRGDGAT